MLSACRTAVAVRPAAIITAAQPGRSAGNPEPTAMHDAQCTVRDVAGVVTEPEAVAPAASFDSAWSIIARTHWDTTYNGVNWRAVGDSLRPRALEARTNAELRGVLSELIARLHQSHFAIFPGSDELPSDGNARGERNAGIGATVRLLDDQIVVTQVRGGGPAAKAGVHAGWTLDRVDGCAVAAFLQRTPSDADPRRRALTAFRIADGMLRGANGSSVSLQFRDGAGRVQRVATAREAEPGTLTTFGNLPAINSSLEFRTAELGSARVGIITFNVWMPIVASQFDSAMDALHGVDAVVIDLRGNFGGVGGLSMRVAGHFLDSARTIGTMRQRGFEMNFVANPRRVNTRAERVAPFAGPLAIVVDELSISTSEIFAAGMQAIGRARVFGAQTSGQALPAVTEPLPNGDILYHAIADFRSPVGRPIEGEGVHPDDAVAITRRSLLAGRDPALDAAVRWAVSPAAQRSRVRLTR